MRVDLTKAEYVEVMEMFKQLTRAWNKEQERLMVAFISKHKLFSSKPSEGSREWSQAELDAIYKMMGGWTALSSTKAD